MSRLKIQHLTLGTALNFSSGRKLLKRLDASKAKS